MERAEPRVGFSGVVKHRSRKYIILNTRRLTVHLRACDQHVVLQLHIDFFSPYGSKWWTCMEGKGTHWRTWGSRWQIYFCIFSVLKVLKCGWMVFMDKMCHLLAPIQSPSKTAAMQQQRGKKSHITPQLYSSMDATYMLFPPQPCPSLPVGPRGVKMHPHTGQPTYE